MESVWLKGVTAPSFLPLEGDVRTDVLVIGGGMAGILCAWQLQKAGVNCLLLEAHTVGSGVTLGTTAKITAQHGLQGEKLLRALGQDRARLYFEANLQAVKEYRRLCSRLDCDFSDADSYVYSRDDREVLERELAALERLKVPALFQKELELPFPTAGAVKFPRQAQFHPLKFLYALARELNIREHTPVRTIHPRRAITDRGTVQAEHIIVATHFPFLNRHGGYFLKLYQDRSYVLALKQAALPRGMYRDADPKGLSLRSAGEFLLLGGGGGRTGKNSLGWRPLNETARRYWPGAETAAAWATQDCMTLDGLPYIGPYGGKTNHLYVAAGFQKWGMTSSMVAAQLLTAAITGREHPAQEIFSPQRRPALSPLAINGMEAAIHLLTPLPHRCPHMGCALRWNKTEGTWDCPCHGSRFSKSGELLDGPAQRGLKE